jgi:two-component system sensor histidine kinase NreB
VTGRVSDDGVGLSGGRHDSHEGEGPGFGVQGMRERASLLGGSLTIQEADGGGTMVTFEVPLTTRRAG